MKGGNNKKCGKPLEAVKGKGMDSPAAPLERKAALSSP